MKTRRLLTIGLLLGALTAAGLSALADEHPVTTRNTGLGSTTVGGYVSSTLSSKQPDEHDGWWWRFLTWLR